MASAYFANSDSFNCPTTYSLVANTDGDALTGVAASVLTISEDGYVTVYAEYYDGVDFTA
jgi:hypothetical protein